MTAIARLLAEKGASQKELAAAVGVSEPTVSDWANGKKTPRGSNAGKIAAFFNIDASVLIQMIAQGNEADIILPTPVLTDADIDAIAQRVQSRTAPALDEKLIEMLTALSPSQVQRVMDFVQGLKAADKA